MALRGTENIIRAINNDPTIVKEVRVSVDVSEHSMHLNKLKFPATEEDIRYSFIQHSLMEGMVKRLEEEGLLNMVLEQSPESMNKRFTCSLFVVDLF